MKTISDYAVSFVVFLAVLGTSVLPAKGQVTQGLVAWYPLAGNLTNQIDPQQTATLMDGARLDSDAVVMSTESLCGSYDGRCAGAIRYPAPLPPTSIFTASLHVYETGVTSPGGGMYLTAGEGADSVYLLSHLWVNQSGIEGSYYARINNGPLATRLFAPLQSTSIRSNWVHYVLVSRTNEVAFYKDGVKLASTNTTPLSVSGDWLSGRHWWYTGGGQLVYSERVLAKLKNLKVFSRALSEDEVRQLYTEERERCIPRTATATAVVVNGFVVAINLLDSGCGYTNAPTVTISEGGGTGATAIAVVENGIVTSVVVTDAGRSYTGVPTVRIGSPPYTPWLEIGVSRVRTTQHVMIGRHYVLESSKDMTVWNQVGQDFIADTDPMTREIDVDGMSTFFRIREIP